MRPFPIFLIILAVPIFANEEDDFKNPIELESQHMDYDTKTIILRESKKLLVTCTYSRDDIGDISDLQWKKEGGKNIDESSSPSVFTVGIRARSGHRKRNLHFTAVHKRDAGTYICYGKNLDGTTYQNTVKIVVLDEIAWNDASTEVGALIGEPLTIDCSVKRKGSLEPHIEITSGNGEALDADLYTIAGNEVTIQELDQTFDGQKISCVHVELVNRMDEDDFPLVDRKDVDIVVWHKPEFDEDVKEQYTIINEKSHKHNHAVIYCNVTASSPPANHFVFYRGNTELADPLKYELTKHVGKHQGAELKINSLNQDDLDEYRCEVNNGKAKSSQIIHLKEAKIRRRPTGIMGPPPEPKVTLEKVKKHSLLWKVESPEKDGDLPIVDVQIQYIRKAVLDDKEMDSDEDEVREEVWDRHAISILRPKTKDHLYEITGLRQGSEYKFKFRQISQAGAGEAVHLSAYTADDVVASPENSSPFVLFVSSITVLIVSLLW